MKESVCPWNPVYEVLPSIPRCSSPSVRGFGVLNVPSTYSLYTAFLYLEPRSPSLRLRNTLSELWSSTFLFVLMLRCWHSIKQPPHASAHTRWLTAQNSSRLWRILASIDVNQTNIKVCRGDWAVPNEGDRRHRLGMKETDTQMWVRVLVGGIYGGGVFLWSKLLKAFMLCTSGIRSGCNGDPVLQRIQAHHPACKYSQTLNTYRTSKDRSIQWSSRKGHIFVDPEIQNH